MIGEPSTPASYFSSQPLQGSAVAFNRDTRPPPSPPLNKGGVASTPALSGRKLLAFGQHAGRYIVIE